LRHQTHLTPPHHPIISSRIIIPPLDPGGLYFVFFQLWRYIPGLNKVCIRGPFTFTVAYPIGLISTLEYSFCTDTPQFDYDPFPYLPPELIVAILSHTPSESIPFLAQTNHFFKLHIDIYQHQLFTIRTRRYPREMLTAYHNMHAIDFDTLYRVPDAWAVLAKFEQKADTCCLLEHLLTPLLGEKDDDVSRRFYRSFFRQWESRRNMFFPRSQWHEALLDRFHIYEDCTRSEICDIVHLQMLYRHVLARLPWSHILLGDESYDFRVHWSNKSDEYRNLVDQIIGCGPEFIVYILSLPGECVVQLLRKYVSLMKSVDAPQLRFCCFDDVMAKLLTRLDGGSQAATIWQEEESYFSVCATTNWFREGDIRTAPFLLRA